MGCCSEGKEIFSSDGLSLITANSDELVAEIYEVLFTKKSMQEISILGRNILIKIYLLIDETNRLKDSLNQDKEKYKILKAKNKEFKSLITDLQNSSDSQIELQIENLVRLISSIKIERDE